ncbi:MAG: hypothetical protein AAGF24_02725 [Cyanobacteria bacterium P01_H01_bin.121]
MQDKQKVTLYLPPELHRKLKIRSAVDAEPMSALAERALNFYLLHPDVVDQEQVYGGTHRIYACPSCESSLALREGELTAVGTSKSIVLDDAESLSVEQAYLQRSQATGEGSAEGEVAELVTC